MGNTLLHRRGERGQGFMELAISLVFLLMLLAVVIDLGWAFYELIALRDAAQEAASFGAMCPTNIPLVTERLRLSATTPLSMEDIPPANIQITIIDPANGNPTAVARGMAIRVSATVDHDIMTPFLGAIIGRQTYPLNVNVTDTILREDCQ